MTALKAVGTLTYWLLMMVLGFMLGSWFIDLFVLPIAQRWNGG